MVVGILRLQNCNAFCFHTRKLPITFRSVTRIAQNFKADINSKGSYKCQRYLFTN